MEHLELLGAVERKEGQVFLTALGKKMASFPLEPRYAKVKAKVLDSITQIDTVLWGSDKMCEPVAHSATWVTHITQQEFGVTLACLVCSLSQTILLSPNFSCSEEILSIVSLLSVDTVLYNPPARREEVLAVRKKFSSSEGDHMTLLNIYRAFKKVTGNKVSYAG